ncbi:DUF397 domain-containing protein [Streptomyces sp. NPDC086989]|uniref:DUF397 domain-containing protein n=1 Tax=Streptomyces sp. NPDC086989 TaxID=3365764 RepID=UPI003806D739
MRAHVNGLSWRKSSHSNSDGANCVEVSDDLPGLVPVRDTKLAGAGPVLVFPAAAWSSFVQGMKSRG